MGDLFIFNKYPKLKKPSEFADSKLLATSNEKEQLAVNFMWHSAEPIHTSLTRDLSFLQVSDAKKIFKSTLSYLREADVEAAFFVSSKGVQNPSLRSEIYCQLVKQLTHNENALERSRGWDLLHLCFFLFPPGEDLENYLEFWIRRNSPEKEFTLCRMYRTISKGAVSRTPSESQIKLILEREVESIGSDTTSLDIDLDRRKLSSPSSRISPKSAFDSSFSSIRSGNNISESKEE
jgi:hypothetical protein